MKRSALALMFAVLFASLGGAAVYFAITPETTEPEVVVDSLPTIERVTEIGELCVVKIKVTDMLQATTPSLKASWLIAGDALISVNLEDVRFNRLDPDSKQIVLGMPSLHVVSPRVNHEKTKHWDTKSVCWHDGWFTYDKLGKSSRLHQAAMKEAQKIIAHVSQDSEVMEDARGSAERMISALYKETGYSVSFDWPDVQKNCESESTGKLLSSLGNTNR